MGAHFGAGTYTCCAKNSGLRRSMNKVLISILQRIVQLQKPCQVGYLYILISYGVYVSKNYESCEAVDTVIAITIVFAFCPSCIWTTAQNKFELAIGRFGYTLC